MGSRSFNLQPTRPAPTSPATASPLSPFSLKKKTMSITQTYYLAHKARAKLSNQAGKSDHDLRLLVGHANLLDSLMLELADAEREQEGWFNQSVRGASVHSEEKIEYEDTIIEEPEEEWDDDSSDSSDDDYDEEEEDVVMANSIALRRVPSATVARIEKDYEHAIEDDEDDEDFAQLELVRSPSHPSSPPELDDDSESSEDETMPPSPPTQMLTFTEKEVNEAQETFYSEGFYLPPRNPARMTTTEISVY